MKIRYSPCYNPRKYTMIEKIDENAIRIIDYCDGKEYHNEVYILDNKSIPYEIIADVSDYRILEAYRKYDELYLTVRRFYNSINNPEWDTGDYHTI